MLHDVNDKGNTGNLNIVPHRGDGEGVISAPRPPSTAAACSFLSSTLGSGSRQPSSESAALSTQSSLQLISETGPASCEDSKLKVEESKVDVRTPLQVAHPERDGASELAAAHVSGDGNDDTLDSYSRDVQEQQAEAEKQNSSYVEKYLEEKAAEQVVGHAREDNVKPEHDSRPCDIDGDLSGRSRRSNGDKDAGGCRSMILVENTAESTQSGREIGSGGGFQSGPSSLTVDDDDDDDNESWASATESIPEDLFELHDPRKNGAKSAAETAIAVADDNDDDSSPRASAALAREPLLSAATAPALAAAVPAHGAESERASGSGGACSGGAATAGGAGACSDGGAGAAGSCGAVDEPSAESPNLVQRASSDVADEAARKKSDDSNNDDDDDGDDGDAVVPVAEEAKLDRRQEEGGEPPPPKCRPQCRPAFFTSLPSPPPPPPAAADSATDSSAAVAALADHNAGTTEICSSSSGGGRGEGGATALTDRQAEPPPAAAARRATIPKTPDAGLPGGFAELLMAQHKKVLANKGDGSRNRSRRRDTSPPRIGMETLSEAKQDGGTTSGMSSNSSSNSSSRSSSSRSTTTTNGTSTSTSGSGEVEPPPVAAARKGGPPKAGLPGGFGALLMAQRKKVLANEGDGSSKRSRKRDTSPPRLDNVAADGASPAGAGAGAVAAEATPIMRKQDSGTTSGISSNGSSNSSSNSSCSGSSSSSTTTNNGTSTSTSTSEVGPPPRMIDRGDGVLGVNEDYVLLVEQQVEMLQNQLKAAGHNVVTELETLDTAMEKLKAAAKKLMGGDEASLVEYEKWSSFVENHPAQKAAAAAAAEAWERENEGPNAAAVREMRRVVPLEIASLSQAELVNERGMPPKLARRLFENKVLWFVRTDPKLIAKLHIAELNGKYAAAGLDLVELRAVYACLPRTGFTNDPTGQKAQYKATVRDRLKELVTAAAARASGGSGSGRGAAGKAAPSARNPAYASFLPALGPDGGGLFDPDSGFVHMKVAAGETYGEAEEDWLATAKRQAHDKNSKKQQQVGGDGGGGGDDDDEEKAGRSE